MLITELGRTTPAAQQLTRQLISTWQAALCEGVRAMQETGGIDRRLDANRTAAALVAAVQGGVTILMAAGGIAHLEAALDTTLALLRAALPMGSDPTSDGSVIRIHAFLSVLPGTSHAIVRCGHVVQRNPAERRTVS